MKTIFLTSFHLLISRNILSTELRSMLSSAGIAIVVIAPEYKRAYLEKEFGGPGITIEGVEQNVPSRSWRGLAFKRLSHFMLNTESIRVYQSYLIWSKKKPFSYRIFFRSAQWLGRWRPVVRFIRFLDYVLRPHGIFDELFSRYKPDLLLATDILNENDVALLQEARYRGVPALGMTRSWDNLSVLGLIRSVPDELLVQTKRLKEEAILLSGVRAGSISIIGIPHYDRYANGPTRDREIFFKAFNLDPQKKLIVFTPVGDLYVRENDVDRPILDILAARKGVDVIVRMPPADRVSGMEDFKAPAHMAFDTPGLLFAGGNRELTKSDDNNLIDEMYYADLVITGPSTIAIEAAFFDKPVIMVNFHSRPKQGPEGIFPYQYDHLQPIIQSGGARFARTREEFSTWIDKYLSDPKLDQEGRRKIVHEQCGGFSDARATERLFGKIAQMLRNGGE